MWTENGFLTTNCIIWVFQRFFLGGLFQKEQLMFLWTNNLLSLLVDDHPALQGLFYRLKSEWRGWFLWQWWVKKSTNWIRLSDSAVQFLGTAPPPQAGRVCRKSKSLSFIFDALPVSRSSAHCSLDEEWRLTTAETTPDYKWLWMQQKCFLVKNFNFFNSKDFASLGPAHKSLQLW